MKAAFAAVAREVLRKVDLRFGDLHWRHHGLGMLQAELSNELRIHIWHPQLRTIPQEGYRDVHDHRFDLTSYVAFGEIIDTPMQVRIYNEPNDRHAIASDVGVTKAWSIVNAKAQERGEVHVTPLGVAHVRSHHPAFYNRGESYGIPRGQFHRTKVNGLTLTLVHRGNFGEEQARVLGEVAHSAIVPQDVTTATLHAHCIYEAEGELQTALEKSYA